MIFTKYLYFFKMPERPIFFSGSEIVHEVNKHSVHEGMLVKFTTLFLHVCGHWRRVEAECFSTDFITEMAVKWESNGFMTAIDPVPNNPSDLHDWAENDHFVIAGLYLFSCNLFPFFPTYTEVCIFQTLFMGCILLFSEN